MKSRSIWLFLLLLIVLIISTFFIKQLSNQESFIGFYGSTEPNTINLTIPNYPNPVNKLYDNDFFDPKNGNVLRVYASLYDSKAGQDTTGTTIDHIDIIDRSSDITNFKHGEPITAGSLTSVPNNYHSWTVYSTDPAYEMITSNQVIYSAWGQDTYIHILDLNNNLNACGFLYSPNLTTPICTNFNANLTKLNPHTGGAKHKNESYIFDDIAQIVLYKFTEHLYYAPLTGDIMIKDQTGNRTIYNRNGNATSDFLRTSGINSTTAAWIQYDLVGNHMMIYAPNKTNTTIIILNKNTDNLTYNIATVGRFLGDGSLQKDATTNIPIPSTLLSTGATTQNITSTPTAAITTNTTFTPAQMNDYILKTNIIPPICPSCPSCPSIGTCTNCGGNSSSSSSSSPASFKSASSPASNHFFAASSPAANGFYHELNEAGSGAKNLIESGASGAIDLGKDTVSGTVGLAKDAATGAVGLGKDIVGGTVGLGRDIVGGAVGLGKDIVGGTVGLGKDAAGSTIGLLKGGGQSSGGVSNNTNSTSGSSGYYAQGVGPQNPFTYNGTLTEKPSSNFIPLTADFSKFGR